MKTLKVSFGIGCHVKRDGFACRDDGQRAKPLGSRMVMSACMDGVQTRLASLRELQSAAGEELSALLPSVLDRAFKGEL
jgi:hypothetical protein